MPGKRRRFSPYCFYRRFGSPTVYARDEYGRYKTFSITPQGIRELPGCIDTLGPIYGRVNFANNVRFNGHTRNQNALRQLYAVAAQANLLTTAWTHLPGNVSAVRRQTNQGMNHAMTVLTGQSCSATRYAIWFDGRNPAYGVRGDQRWEWCHLLAHGMGGADNHTNIVAARKGNNSEQLAIESALQMYRRERVFQMKIRSLRLNGGDGVHLGNLIRYKVRCIFGGNPYNRFLDCLNAPDPSEIHYYDLLRQVAMWANNKLEQISQQIHHNAVSKAERRQIENYLEGR